MLNKHLFLHQLSQIKLYNSINKSNILVHDNLSCLEPN